MYYEEPRIPALPGEENVTDGSVDDYGTDWENVDNGALEEEMAKCAATPCDVKTTCPDNDPEQTDDNDPEQTDVLPYEIVTE